MTTSASFVPAAVPECPYAPRMTRAQAIALAAAGGLLENCVVVVTDGPTIGNAALGTSATEIELNPVSPTELGQTARVHQGFTTEAWAGLYDINLGTSGSIIRLTDNRNNTVIDTDTNSPTVHTQFPWGAGTLTQVRDNYVDDSTFTFTAPLTAGFTFTDNTAQNAQFDFTGLTTNFCAINNSEFRTAKLAVSSTSTGVISVSRLKLTGVLATTAYLTIANTGAGGTTVRGVEINEAVVTTSHSLGSVSIIDSTVKGNGSTVTFAAAGTINDSRLQTANVNIQTGTTSNNTINRSNITGGAITKTTGSTGVLNIDTSTLSGTTITLGAANGGTTNTWQNIDAQGSVFTLNGPPAPGRNDFTNGAKFGGCSVTVAATATAGIGVNNGWIESYTIVQNRTAGTGSTTLFDCSMRGFGNFTDNGTTDPGVSTSFSRITAVDSTITVGNITGQTLSGTILQQADLIGSTLTLVGPNGPSSATSFLDKLRLHGSGLANAGFGCQNLIIDGVGGTTTLTAYNLNRLKNKAFSDVV